MLNGIAKRITSLLSPLLAKRGSRYYTWKLSYEALRDLGLKHPLVLDIGCGDGKAIMTHRDLTGELIGLDMDPESLRKARTRKLPVVLGDATRLPFRSHCFDTVTCFQLIEHIDEEGGLALLNEIHRVLKESGYTIIVTPNRNRHNMLVYRFLTRVKERYPLNPDHIVEYTKADLETLFSKANFKHYEVNSVGLFSVPGFGIISVPWLERGWLHSFLTKYCRQLLAILRMVPGELPRKGR